MYQFCPFCTKAIMPETTQCPACGNIYGTETLKLLKNTHKEPPQEHPNERRKNIRVPKTFKVVYHTPKAFINHYLSDISTGGLFIKINNPPNQGEKFNLKIFLPNGGKELEVSCEVIWSHGEERMTPDSLFYN